MKIAFFHATLPEPGRKVGGVEVFVHRLATQLSRRGHDVTLFTFTDAPKHAIYNATKLRPSRLSASALGRMIAVPLMLNTIDFSQFDILHLHGDDWFYVRRTLPTIRTFYGSSLLEAINSDRWLRRARQAITYPLELLSSRMANASYSIADQGMPFYRLNGVLPCGVEIPTSEPIGKTEHPTILFVGTWLGRKRGAFLEQKFREVVLPAFPNAELWMVSDQCNPSPQVKFIRFPDDDELVALYQRSWIFCLPSTYEGFGIPYIEAMANGSVVVATPNPGSQYVLQHGRSGVIASDAELGATLLEVIVDKHFRDAMAVRGRTRALEFSWVKIVEQHERAYNDIAARDTT